MAYINGWEGPKGRHGGRGEKDEIDANAKNNGMAAGRAVTYAVADPEWSIFDGPPAGAPAWLPPGGPRRGIG